MNGLISGARAMTDDDHAGQPAARAACRWIDDLPPFMHDRYETMMLISERAQATLPQPGGTDTVYVCSDWLMWQQLIAEGYHAVHYEFGILKSQDEKSGTTQLLLRANDWIFSFAENPTLFHGVSLGHLVAGEVGNSLVSYHKFRLSIGGICKHFGCRNLVFFDLRTDVNMLSPSVRRSTVKIIAEDMGMTFDDRSADASESRAISETVYGRSEKPAWQRLAGGLYDFCVETATHAAALFTGKRPRVLVLVNRNVLSPLLDSIGRADAAIGVLSRTPKPSARNLFQLLRQGVRMVASRNVALTPAEKAEVEAIQGKLAALPDKAKTAEERFVFNLVAKLEPESARLTSGAETVKSSELLFDRFKPDRIVLDGIKNMGPRANVEVARARGIDVDYIWHSPLVPQMNRMDALGGDSRQAPRVTRCLTWGDIHERWLDRVESAQPRVRVGSPIAERYRTPAAAAKEAGPGTSSQVRNVLVLLYTPQVDEVFGLNANIYQSFADAVNILRRGGVEHIRYKLHPGPGRWKKEYFEDIRDYLGFDCDILKKEPFDECVAWADAVLGPITSGAVMETIAAGKEYYPLLLHPHAQDPSFYGDFKIFESTADACQALLERRPMNGAALLEAMYDMDASASNADRFWDAVSAPATGSGVPQ